MPSEQRESAPRAPGPYYRASRFRNERLAKRAYFRGQETVFSAQGCELSVYRFLLNGISHVAVLGDQPPTDLDQKLRGILGAGEPTTLPEDILDQLFERRAQASEQGEWVERHFRPGIDL